MDVGAISNTPLASDGGVEGSMVSVVREVPEKAYEDMVVTPEGMLMLFSDEHQLSANFCSVVSDEGRDTEESPVHPSKV